MAAKALIDSPETVVASAINGLVSGNSHLARLDGYPDVSRRLVASAAEAAAYVRLGKSTIVASLTTAVPSR